MRCYVKAMSHNECVVTVLLAT